MALFFRLLSADDKSAGLRTAVDAARSVDGANPVAYVVEPASFRRVPGSPFAYWVSKRVLHLFERSGDRNENWTTKCGMGTLDDFRFVRLWWEASRSDRRWVPFAKGGAFSPFYADVHLLVDWQDDGKELKRFVEAKVGSASRKIQATSFYFRPGLTWPRRTDGLSFRVLPAECIFADKGPAAFVDGDNHTKLLALSGLLNSAAFGYLVSVQLARTELAQSYEVGLIQQTPVPTLDHGATAALADLASKAWSVKRSLDTSNETSHAFAVPALLQEGDETLALRTDARRARERAADAALTDIQARIDDLAFHLYDIDENDRRAMQPTGSSLLSTDSEEANDEDVETEPTIDDRPLTTALLSYALGCVFGHWDARLATGDRKPLELPDPFSPLPMCSPGMLAGADNLPAPEAPPGYPLRVDWDGMLVDDPGPDGNSPHQDDIVRRVREVLELLFGDRYEAIEREACEILGVKDLRESFRIPSLFFAAHIKRYSKSRRKAPIYWLLQSSKRSYGLWLYYHRLDRDTVFKALRNYVLPKSNGETTRLREMTDKLEKDKASLPQSQRTKREKAIEKQEALLTELTAFKEALERVAALGYDPDLNDGVVLNIAPFHEITPWKVAKQYWDELCEAKYEWSTMSKRLREKGVVGGG